MKGLTKSAHPWVCIFHCAFKLAGISTFLFLSVFLNSMCSFVLVSCAAVCDFWTAKNISGRFLVGLRWWSFIDPEGNEKWVFENRAGRPEYQNNKIDSVIFWYSQIGATLFWGLIIFWELMWLRVFWTILSVICFGLSFTNLYAYYQCNADYKKKMGKYKSYGNFILNFIRGQNNKPEGN